MKTFVITAADVATLILLNIVIQDMLIAGDVDDEMLPEVELLHEKLEQLLTDLDGNEDLYPHAAKAVI